MPYVARDESANIVALSDGPQPDQGITEWLEADHQEVAAYLDPPPTLAEAKRQIDAAAEAKRQEYITPGDGQAQEYREKNAELDRYASDASPEKADYPWMAAEIGITGADLAAVDDAMSTRRATWRTVGPKIAAHRRERKEAAEAAADGAERQAVLDAVDFDGAVK